MIGRIAYPDESWEPWFVIQQPASNFDQVRPAVAGGRGQFLAARESEAGFVTNYHIHGRLVFPERIFRDGLESGTTGNWSSKAP